MIRVIENPKNVLDSSLGRFPASFTLESLKKWFERAKNYSAENEIYIVKNLMDQKARLDLETMYKKHYVRTENFPGYFFEEKREEIAVKTEKETKSFPPEEKRRFQRFSIDQVLSGPHIVAFATSEANECPGCGYKRTLNYSVSLFDGSTVRVCHECADKVEELMRTSI